MSGKLKRFTQEQIDEADRVDLVEYVKRLGYEVSNSGAWSKVKDMGGLYFKREANTWHWETQDCGGKGCISLCMKLENKSFVDAVKTLAGEEMNSVRHDTNWQPEPLAKPEFVLPQKNNTDCHVFAYLTKTRGLDELLVKALFRSGMLYENTYRSCVFVGFDEHKKPRHASVRSTNTVGKIYKMDVPGSEKQYSFSSRGTSETINVFEAPIDLLSYMNLQMIEEKPINDSYVALGGVTDRALERYLSLYPDIRCVNVCTDNDEAGNNCYERLKEKYGSKYEVIRTSPKGKDFNEDLIAHRRQEEIEDVVEQMMNNSPQEELINEQAG